MQNCFYHSRQFRKQLFGFGTMISKYHTSKDCIHSSEFPLYNNSTYYYRSNKVPCSLALAKTVGRVFYPQYCHQKQ